MKNIVYCLILISGLLVMCTGSKLMTKKAKKLEISGLYEEASKFYFEALKRNKNNVDARIGLKNVGEKVINEKLNKIYKSYAMKEHKSVVYSYIDAKKYQEKNSKYINLDIGLQYEEYYKESEAKYLENIYQDAKIHLNKEEFDEATKIFTEILEINKNYKDVNQLLNQSYSEPIYRKGIIAFEEKKYRTCYSLMNQVLNKASSYKDAIDYKNKSVDKGLITMAVTPFETNNYSANKVKDLVYSNLIKNLLQLNNPFIKLIDRQNTEKIINEQKLNLSGAVQSKTAINVGNIYGVKMLITGKINSYSSSGNILNRELKQAYLSYKIKKYNPKTKKSFYETKYKKTNYIEYKGYLKIIVNVEYKMISTETGEILISSNENIIEKDEIVYAEFKGDGNVDNLYPGSYKSIQGPVLPSDRVITSRYKVRELRKKFTNRKQLKTEGELNISASNKLAKKITDKINSYNPEI